MYLLQWRWWHPDLPSCMSHEGEEQCAYVHTLNTESGLCRKLLALGFESLVNTTTFGALCALLSRFRSQSGLELRLPWRPLSDLPSLARRRDIKPLHRLLSRSPRLHALSHRVAFD